MNLKKLPAILMVGAALTFMAWQLQRIYTAPKPVSEIQSYPELLAGTEFFVPETPGVYYQQPANGGLLLFGGMNKLSATKIDLCQQRISLKKNSRLLPIYAGMSFEQMMEVAEMNKEAGRPLHMGLKNPVLDDGSEGVDIPDFFLNTWPPKTQPENTEGFSMTFHRVDAAWVSDLEPGVLYQERSQARFRRSLWLLWDRHTEDDGWGHSLQVRHRPHSSCSLGQIQMTLYRHSGNDAVGHVRAVFYDGGDSAKIPLTFTLKPGLHQVPERRAPKEDAELFKRAVAAGLIREENGLLKVAPRDEMLAKELAEAHPNQVPVEVKTVIGPETKKIHRQLYYSPPGRFIRREIRRYNADRLLAAVRIKPGPASDWLGENPRWQVSTGGRTISVEKGMPLMAGRLFDELPLGWRPWSRAKLKPGMARNATVRFRLQFARSVSRKQTIELLAVGEEIRVKGAVSSGPPQWRCLEDPCSKENAVARLFSLTLKPGADYLEVTFKPLQADRAPELYRYNPHVFSMENGKIRWRQPGFFHAGEIKRRKNARVTLQDRKGRLIWQDGTQLPESHERPISSALIGLGGQRQIGVTGLLGRLGDYGEEEAEAWLTLDLEMEQLARQVTSEAYLRAGEIFASERGEDPHAGKRAAAFVVLDAEQGDIIAAAGFPELPEQADWADLHRFAATHPGQNYFRVIPWQMDGGIHRMPGSTFKLVTSLALETLAEVNEEVEEMLDGLDLKELKAAGRPYGLTVDSDCYPAGAGSCTPKGEEKKPAIHNYRTAGYVETLRGQMNRLNDEQYGLKQALRDSINNWFAWNIERFDRTLLDRPNIPGIPHARLLTPEAPKTKRPLQAVAHRLGFGKAFDLSAGLLPEGFERRPGDVLQSSESFMDPIWGRHNVRQAAIGIRVQATPLQMAVVAASIASGAVVKPRLLLELNGREAGDPDFEPLNIYTDRIKQGMQRVPIDGTAKKIFNQDAYKYLQEHLYLKTGTAPLGGHDGYNIAWVIGWIEPTGRIDRPLAFACMISHTVETGGQACGRQVAEFLHGWLSSEEND